MSNRTNDRRNIDPLSTIPNFLTPPEGVFEDIEHYRIVAERITRTLASAGKSKKSVTVSGSSLYDGIKIEFSSAYKEEEIFLDNFASKIVLRAPKHKGETTTSLLTRRMFYLEHLIRSVEAMKTIGVSRIYLSIKEEGRMKISKSSRKVK